MQLSGNVLTNHRIGGVTSARSRESSVSEDAFDPVVLLCYISAIVITSKLPFLHSLGLFKMPLPTASGILRRIQDSIYTPSSSPAPPSQEEVVENGHDDISAAPQTTLSFNQSATSINEMEQHQLRIPPMSPTPSMENLVSSGPSVSSDHEDTSARSTRESNDRRWQTSSPSTSSPDVNAQSFLRKRILEIQQLEIGEREKARRVQVSTLLKLVLSVS